MIEIWDLASRTLHTEVRPHKASFDAVQMVFTPDSSTLASLGEFSRGPVTTEWIRFRIHVVLGDRNWFPPVELVVLDTTTGRVLLRSMDDCRTYFSPDGRFLATNHSDGTILHRAMPTRQGVGK